MNLGLARRAIIARSAFPRGNKYGATQVVVEGRKFHSKREAARYQELLLLAKAGQIRQLQCQVRFPLFVNGQRVSTYVADFVYETPEGFVIEDCKGFRTALYKLKRRFMAALGFPITES